MKKLLATIMMILPLTIEAMVGERVVRVGLEYEIAPHNKKILRRPVNPALTRVVVPADVIAIEEGCFYEYGSLREVIFEPGSQLQRIEKLAFGGTDITKITIPASVEVIGKWCFWGCDLLQVKFEPGSQLQKIEKCAFRDTSIKTITIPARVTEIGGGCFWRCCNLCEIIFEDSSQLKRFGEYAFTGTCIEEVSIPSRIEMIDAVLDYATPSPYSWVRISRTNEEGIHFRARGHCWV